AFEDPGAVDRPEDRHAEPGERPGHRQLLAAADRRAHARHDGAAVDRDEAVARVDRLHAARRAFVEEDDLDALLAERRPGPPARPRPPAAPGPGGSAPSRS